MTWLCTVHSQCTKGNGALQLDTPQNVTFHSYAELPNGIAPGHCVECEEALTTTNHFTQQNLVQQNVLQGMQGPQHAKG